MIRPATLSSGAIDNCISFAVTGVTLRRSELRRTLLLAENKEPVEETSRAMQFVSSAADLSRCCWRSCWKSGEEAMRCVRPNGTIFCRSKAAHYRAEPRSPLGRATEVEHDKQARLAQTTTLKETNSKVKQSQVESSQGSLGLGAFSAGKSAD